MSKQISNKIPKKLKVALIVAVFIGAVVYATITGDPYQFRGEVDLNDLTGGELTYEEVIQMAEQSYAEAQAEREQAFQEYMQESASGDPDAYDNYQNTINSIDNTDEVRFSPEEAAAYRESVAGIEVDDDVEDMLAERLAQQEADERAAQQAENEQRDAEERTRMEQELAARLAEQNASSNDLGTLQANLDELDVVRNELQAEYDRAVAAGNSEAADALKEQLDEYNEAYSETEAEYQRQSQEMQTAIDEQARLEYEQSPEGRAQSAADAQYMREAVLEGGEVSNEAIADAARRGTISQTEAQALQSQNMLNENRNTQAAVEGDLRGLDREYGATEQALRNALARGDEAAAAEFTKELEKIEGEKSEKTLELQELEGKEGELQEQAAKDDLALNEELLNQVQNSPENIAAREAMEKREAERKRLEDLRNKTIIPFIVKPGTLPGPSAATRGSGAGIRDYILKDWAPQFIKGFIGLVAVASVIFIMIGGIQFILAFGDEEKVTEARQTLLAAAAGLVISILSYAIIRIVTFLFV